MMICFVKKTSILNYDLNQLIDDNLPLKKISSDFVILYNILYIISTIATNINFYKTELYMFAVATLFLPKIFL